jgi:FkbM family methyltransferase
MKHKGHDKFWSNVEAGTWEPETFEVLNKYCAPGKTFIDIGAWNGVCSIYAAGLGAECRAVEPDPEALRYLQENIKLNEANVRVYNVCIADKDGQVELNTQESFGNSRSSIVDRGGIATSTSVRAVTLETFVRLAKIDMAQVCLVKIDIEGGEVDLITQAESFLKDHKPVVYLSLHPAWFPNKDTDTERIADVLFGIYRVFGTDGREYERWEFLEAVNRGVHSLVLTV